MKTFFRLVPLILVATTLASCNDYNQFYKVVNAGGNSTLGAFFADPWNTSDLVNLTLLLVHIYLPCFSHLLQTPPEHAEEDRNRMLRLRHCFRLLPDDGGYRSRDFALDGVYCAGKS